ncbi:helix-turn-helix domain-containing protein [Phaeobacter gallaeciensis]|uniref:helix-turn-helix domain-containing protein n=1 Tax=Phaeobacter gallaeciensis TaxID=60890 RepID=UPI003CD01E04
MTTPFTPETLGLRWGVSATTIRNMCNQGELNHFRLGRLYRIPAAVVEEKEQCQTSASDVSGADTASIGMKAASEDVIALRHAPERKPSQKR